MIYDGGFYLGKYDGQGRKFYDNGNIYYIGEFRVGKETGQGVYYDESGNEIQTSTGEQSQQSSAA